MRKLYSLFLVLILVVVPVSTALGQKDLNYYFTCIAMVQGFANKNPRTKDDAIVLATAYDLQKMEKCLLDLTNMFEQARKVAIKASVLARE
ncbi:MAG: hypothetical protein OXK19_00975 [Candidatus Dadabacteria bacterium]|nr:hypothetical protein [Candidatus Dadabacteria bacterium]